ncbi:MAG: choice-of-anchor D domain-containing protein [Acidobacteriia bacterium]|nr:choice-of-anchor D domain-containing protein [Terriglobia bacterium]
MSAHQLRGVWLGLFLTVVCSLFLTGCQILSAGGSGGGSVVVGTASLNFGTVAVGSSKTLPDTLSNNTASPVTISAITGSSSDLQVLGITAPLVLGAGASVPFTVQFQPSTVGSLSRTVSLMGANSDVVVSFTASGASGAPGQLTLSPSSVAFGSIKVGSSQTNSVTLSNAGGADITVNQATLSGAGFSISNLSLPLTLAAGSTASLSVTFAPTGSGSFSGSVTFATGSGNVVLPISGIGVAPGQLTASPSSLAFGSVQVGHSSSQSETLTNTGGSSVTISQANASGTGFSLSGLTVPVTLATNQSVTFNVGFAPATAGAANGTLAIVSDASVSPFNIALSGTALAPGSLTANPASASFGSVTVGSNKTVSVAVTNTGGASVTVSSAAASGSGFSFTGPNLPLTLNAGQSATFSAIFAPTTAGAASGTLTINSNASNATLSVPLSGTGIAQGQISPTPSSFSFGTVQTGASKSLSGTLTNSGGSSLTISAATASGTGFSLSGLTLPLTLNAGQSASFTVLFAPTTSGAASGSISITSNGANPNLSIPLSGTGVTPGTLSASPASLSFGNVQVGNSSSKPETVTNTGGTAVTISAATASGTGFSMSGLTVPLTLNAGQSTSFTVLFAPATSGAASGNVSITSDASVSNLTIALSGTGVTPGQISPNPSSFSFGNVQTGTSKSLSGTLTNSGGTSLTISAASASGTGFSLNGLTLPLTLNAGQSTSFTVLFAPTASGAASGSISVTSNGANPNLSIPLSGTGVTPGTLSANPASHSFGSVQVGSSSSTSETVTNTGGSAVTISQANVTGAAYSVSGLTLPTTLSSSQSVTFTVTFAPTSAGSASGTVSIVSNASNSPLSIALSGTGTTPGQLAVSPASLNFGNVVDGSSSALSGSLNATGASVTISSASITNNEFVLSGITLPLTLTAGSSTPFTVTFTPQSSGAASGNLSFISNATNSPAVQTLAGTGTVPPQHSVDLTWNSSANAVGYNIYRGSVSGGPYSIINTSLDATTAFTDNNVTAGQTYYYVVTAVDASSNESGYSNQTSAAIPTP